MYMDYERCNRFCSLLRDAWMGVPTLRFGQFIEAFFWTIKKQGRDPFYIEDDEMYELLKAYKEKHEHEN